MSKDLIMSKGLDSDNYVKCPKGYSCSPGGGSQIPLAGILGSLLSPSLPDSRDMKDKLYASVDNQCSGNVPTKTVSDATNCAIASRQMENPSLPFNSNDYIKKDSIPCYGCNLD
jgi:hypothetical protein